MPDTPKSSTAKSILRLPVSVGRFFWKCSKVTARIRPSVRHHMVVIPYAQHPITTQKTHSHLLNIHAYPTERCATSRAHVQSWTYPPVESRRLHRLMFELMLGLLFRPTYLRVTHTQTHTLAHSVATRVVCQMGRSNGNRSSNVG